MKKININEEEWVGMPEYNNVKLPAPLITATFKFATQKDYDEFHSIVKTSLYGGKKVFDGMQRKEAKQAWYPLKEKASKYRYL
jgi:hypothetical protein